MQGDPVVVSGLQVGRVSSVELGEEGVMVDFAVTNDDISLGDLTTARVGVATVLGDKSLILTSEGDGSLAQGSTIPLSRTTSPYDVSEALSQLTTETGAIDVDTVAKALETVSVTLDQASPELRDAINGVGRLSQTISSRDETLRSLLSHAGDFSRVLSDRSEDLTTLIRQGNILFGELLARRDDVETLLSNVSRMSQSLGAVVDANAKNLKPTLESLNRVLGVLQQNKQNISKALDGLAVYATGLGEVVSSGPFFTAYLQNLLPGNFVPPGLNLTPRTGGGQ
jgi:phospholipid/cholesterol/gamma-HCH transport system substrate-binding protein